MLTRAQKRVIYLYTKLPVHFQEEFDRDWSYWVDRVRQSGVSLDIPLAPQEKENKKRVKPFADYPGVLQ